MFKIDYKLIANFYLGKIDEKEFFKSFAYDLRKDNSYVTLILKDALKSKDRANVEYAMGLGWHFEFPADCAEVLCELLLEDWHISHEDIARVLKKLAYPGSVECLYQTALKVFPYLDFEEPALAIKCAYALYAIGNDAAKEKLHLLANADNEIIAARAKKLLGRLADEAQAGKSSAG